mgnify:FL=1
MADLYQSTSINPLEISGTALAAQRVRMNTIANNIANVNTTRNDKGFHDVFRRKEVVLRTGNVPGTGSQRYGVEVKEVLPDQSAFRRLYQPGHPDADQHGYVMMPNVHTPLEMVDMIEASRAYEANLTAIQVTKTMNSKSLEILS